MVSPGTHLVKNHESQTRTNESRLKKKKKLKILGILCNQTVNLKTDSNTLYGSILQTDIINATEIKRTGLYHISTNTHVHID